MAIFTEVLTFVFGTILTLSKDAGFILTDKNGGGFLISTRLPVLDIARTFAIAGVVLVHSAQSVNSVLPLPNAVFQLAETGRFGVQVFFVLSGFLIAHLYTQAPPFHREKPVRWIGQYLARRAARIYPLWIGFLAIYLTVFLCFPQNSILSETVPPSDTSFTSVLRIVLLGLLFAYWTVPNLANVVIPGGWSIELEVIHYFLYLPFRRMGMSGILWSIAAIEAIGVLVFWAAQTFDGTAGAISVTFDRLGLSESILFFATGIVARRLTSSLTEKLTKVSALGLAAAATLAAIHPGMFVEIMPKFGFVAIVFVLSYVLVKIDFVSTVSASIAKYSYFIYFFHFLTLQPLQDVLGTLSLPPVLGLVIFSILSLALSYGFGFVSYRIYERPIMKFVQARTSGT